MSNITQFEYNGFLISGDREDKLINLNQIWKASSESITRDPRHWLESGDVKKFIEQLTKELNVGIFDILKTKRGKGGGTWAHWQIALAYAKYLNPELHIAVNNWAMRFLEEERNPELGVNRAVKNWKKQGKSQQWIEARVKRVVTRHEFTDTLKEHGCEGYDYAKCTNAIYEPLLGGTAIEIKQQRGITKNLRDNLSRKEIAMIDLAEIIAEEEIEEKNLQGGYQCKSACVGAGNKIKRIIE
jgi:hypothetical protein